MKKALLVIIPIILLAIGVFVFRAPKVVDAAKGDRAQYTLSPWTFYQTGASTDDWNNWELCAYLGVEMRDNASNIASFADTTFNKWNNEYSQPQHFDHPAASTHNTGGERTVEVSKIAHGYKADIELNGWSAKWIPEEQETQEPDPPKWGEPITTQGETTSFEPYLMDNNPYTVRSWISAELPKKNRSYTWQFDAYISGECKMADPTWKMEEHNYQPAPQIKASNKYCKIVGKNGAGKILFVRYMDITTKKKTFRFNFDLTASDHEVHVEYMYGAFLLPGSIIKHKECAWSGTVHIENCDIIEGNLNAPEETTTKRSGGGGNWNWGDTPEKITGVKAKNKKKKSVILSWSGDENADKYQYNYALKKNFKGGKKKYTTKKKVTIKKLKKKKTYYFRVRGVSEDNGAGPWSKKKKVKIKK